MGLFDRLACFYYVHVEDKIEKVFEPIGEKIADSLPSNEQVDRFYGNISDNVVKGLDKLEDSVDKIEEKIDDSLDYISDKVFTPQLEKFIDNSDRFFENCEALLSEDPYIEGKKQGYEKASYYYKAVYISTKDSYVETLQSLNNKQDSVTDDIQILEKLLQKKKNELKRITQKREAEKVRVSKITGLSLYDFDNFTLFPKNRNVLDAISSKKLRQLRKGQLDGYNEAKTLYEQRLIELKTEFEKNIQDKINLISDYIKLYEDMQQEIMKMTETIISLSLIEEE